LAARGPAAELTRRIVASIPTIFGKLAYLGSLRDIAGHYAHRDLERALGPEDADRNLKQLHQQVFSQWLRFGLSEQKADLEEYLREAGDFHSEAAYRGLTPATAHEVERQLYVTDLETLLELLRLERNGAFSNREA
jgi:hypothetical protein